MAFCESPYFTCFGGGLHFLRSTGPADLPGATPQQNKFVYFIKFDMYLLI